MTVERRGVSTMNELKVTITGRAHTGKSTLARELGRYMRDKLGYEINVFFDDQQYQRLTDIDITDQRVLEPIRIRLEVREGYGG
ncbi:MAG TPA: hypothetical protein PLN42_01025 [Anaerolineae bacterium]|nr:hypothetical protein [Anaerolineae bacterium]